MPLRAVSTIKRVLLVCGRIIKDMKKRIARKILNTNSFHWKLYKSRGGALFSLVPIHPNLYYKACRTLHIEPYYDPEWLKDILSRINNV